MLTFLKNLVLSTFLKNEVAALKARLADASAALDKIESEVVGLAKEASADAQGIAEKVLADVLASADKLRAKEGPFGHEWEAKLYADYEAGKADVASVYSRALAWLEKTEIFFRSKL